MLDKLGLPRDAEDAFKKLFRNAKQLDPGMTEKEFIKIIMLKWLSDYKYRKDIASAFMTKDTVQLKNNIRSAIKNSGKSQRQIAKEIGIANAYISQMASERHDPSLKVALLLMHALGYPPNRIQDIFYLEPKQE